MIDNRYELEISNDFKTFEFVSEGSKGSIVKLVSYNEINIKGYYNLGFGDKDMETGFVSDLIVTNNGDSKRVLQTVAATLYTFTEMNKEAIVIATGSTEARTRLYRMGITNNLEFIERDFFIFGLNNKKWEIFMKNIAYSAFLVYRKH
jgi:hypothetical protein